MRISDWSSDVCSSDLADWAAAMFDTVGRRSANAEHGRATGLINGRLHAVRTVESQVIDDVRAELQALATAITCDDRVALRRLIVAYHKRRLRMAADIVRALYRADCSRRTAKQSRYKIRKKDRKRTRP